MASNSEPQPPLVEDSTVVESSLMEAMFKRALQPTGAFAEDLQAAGYDPKRLELKYPITVWRACLAVARKHAFGNLPEKDAYRALGVRFIEGFFETLIGKFVSVGLPLMGVEGVIKRSPRLWKAGRKGMTITPIREGDRCWRIAFVDRYALPEFIGGVVQAVVAQLNVDPVVLVENEMPGRFELRITW